MKINIKSIAESVMKESDKIIENFPELIDIPVSVDKILEKHVRINEAYKKYCKDNNGFDNLDYTNSALSKWIEDIIYFYLASGDFKTSKEYIFGYEVYCRVKKILKEMINTEYEMKKKNDNKNKILKSLQEYLFDNYNSLNGEPRSITWEPAHEDTDIVCYIYEDNSDTPIPIKNLEDIHNFINKVGHISGIKGDVTGIKGCITGINGNDCGITDEERKQGA